MPGNKIGGLDRGQGLNRLEAQAEGNTPEPVERGFEMNAETDVPGKHNAEGDGPAVRTSGKNKGSGG